MSKKRNLSKQHRALYDDRIFFVTLSLYRKSMLRRRSIPSSNNRPIAQDVGADAMLNASIASARIKIGPSVLNVRKLAKRYGTRTVAANLATRGVLNPECRRALSMPGIDVNQPGPCQPLTVPTENVQTARMAKQKTLRRIQATTGRSRNIQSAVDLNEKKKQTDDAKKQSIMRKLASGDFTSNDVADSLLDIGDSALTGALRSLSNPYAIMQYMRTPAQATGTARMRQGRRGVAEAVEITSLILMRVRSVFASLKMALKWTMIVSIIISIYKKVRDLNPSLPRATLLDGLVSMNDDMIESVLTNSQAMAIAFTNGAAAAGRYVLRGKTDEPEAKKPDEPDTPDQPAEKTSDTIDPDLSAKQSTDSAATAAAAVPANNGNPLDFSRAYRRDFGAADKMQSIRRSYDVSKPDLSTIDSMADEVIREYGLTSSSTSATIRAALAQALRANDAAAKSEHPLKKRSNQRSWILNLYGTNLKSTLFRRIFEKLGLGATHDHAAVLQETEQALAAEFAKHKLKERAVAHRQNDATGYDYVIPETNELRPPSTATDSVIRDMVVYDTGP